VNPLAVPPELIPKTMEAFDAARRDLDRLP